MKITRERPKATKVPVFLTEDCYEMFYCRPLNLGKITKQNKYWYTEDGMKFMSSRSALEYLIRIWEAKAPQDLAGITVTNEERVKIRKDMERSVKKKPEVARVQGAQAEDKPASQQLIQEFLEFVEFKKRAGAPMHDRK